MWNIISFLCDLDNRGFNKIIQYPVFILNHYLVETILIFDLDNGGFNKIIQYPVILIFPPNFVQHFIGYSTMIVSLILNIVLVFDINFVPSASIILIFV